MEVYIITNITAFQEFEVPGEFPEQNDNIKMLGNGLVLLQRFYLTDDGENNPTYHFLSMIDSKVVAQRLRSKIDSFKQSKDRLEQVKL
ncbi:hypothetical protein COT97_04230 [Candidatus Falkowbacteria bacterium CG10_big_fil_rev_8_21_14_0_10_39_11]|uniref:Uncharacterized protein n=1 Tax=Candidatus Falkowbacteria bacterium CG10_big_fil_rev_8_21_14_0_10_39_11 TaxID=1974565 RepID=A0A2H0V499_9BACT|nr:MAG: hypothetical protein COT97_04230 [Candidatus Falkowbacteria bacterium CG10_big_fil_rev_8_21_14_0_10_39_11]